MAGARIQERIGQTEYNAVTVMTQAPVSAFTSGSLIVVCTGAWKNGPDQTVSSVDDPVNTPYTQAFATPRIDSEVIQYQYYKANNTATTAEVITVTWSDACAGGLTLVEYSGIAAAPTVVTATSSGSSTTMSSGAANASVSSVFVASGGYNTGGPCTISDTPGGSFTKVHEFDENNDSQSIAVAEQLNVSGSQTCTWTLNPTATWTAGVAAYEVDSGAAAGQPIQPRRAQVPFQGAIQPSFTGIK